MSCCSFEHSFVTSWENVLFTLENIGTCVRITWNYFPCVVLHKVKVFIDYAQGLVQLSLLIFTIDSFIFAMIIFIKDSKAVNYSKIIGLINLKYGKSKACRDNFFTMNAELSQEEGKRSSRCTNLNLSK